MGFHENMEKGKVGEDVVEKFLLDNNYITYKATDKKSHPFDYIVLNPRTGKITSVEVKYKEYLKTGNVCLYLDEVQEYKRNKTKFGIKELWIAFVNPKTHSIFWVEINTKFTTIIKDSKGKRLVIWGTKSND